MSEETTTFILGTIIGGVISGVVGLLAAHYTHRLEQKESSKQNIYRPLFNQVSSLLDKRYFLRADHVNPWLNLDNYSKFKADPPIQALFQRYTEEVQKWKEAHSNLELFFSENLRLLASFLEVAFAKGHLLENNGQIILQKGMWQDVAKWAEEFRYVLFDPRIDSADLLYTALKAYATGAHSAWIDGFRERYPLIYNDMFEELIKARVQIKIDDKIGKRKSNGKRPLNSLNR